jgi:hypothetical protein
MPSTSIACPQCRSRLALPERTTPDSSLRCPSCKTEFPIPSAWPENEDGDELEAGDVAEPTSPGERKSTAVRRRYYSRTRLPKHAAKKPRARRHRPKKTKLTTSDYIKLALSALFALPAAQLVLWWGFGRDPLSLGPTVSARVPFVVPRGFRGGDQAPIEVSNTYPSHPETTLREGNAFDFIRDPNREPGDLARPLSPISAPPPIFDPNRSSFPELKDDGTFQPK